MKKNQAKQNQPLTSVNGDLWTLWKWKLILKYLWKRKRQDRRFISLVFGKINVIYITIITLSILSFKQALAFNITINPLYS